MICYVIKIDSIVVVYTVIDTTLMGLCQEVKSSIIRIAIIKDGQTTMRRLRVKEVAQAKGFTMARLQRAADINLKTMQSIWHNPRHDASLNTLDKLAKALGVPVTELIEDVPEELSPSAPTGKQPKKVAENMKAYSTDENED